MRNNQLIAGAIADLCDALGVSTDKRRMELEDVLGDWIDTLPTIEAEHAKDDRMYWVQVKGIGGKRRGWRASTDKYPWFVEGFTANFSDGAITVLGEVERDDDNPNHPNYPEALATVEDFENAPRGTISAINGYGALTKRSEGWRDLHGFPNTNEGVANRAETATYHVLRWGDSK